MSSRDPYDVVITRDAGRSDATLSAAPRAPIAGGAPPQFGGTDGVWSPEHLLVSAAALCFLTTVDWFAKRAPLALGPITIDARGEVAKDAGGLAMSRVALVVRTQAPAAQIETLTALLHQAHGQCLISRSLRCPVELSVEVAAAG